MVDKKDPELRFKGFTEDWEHRKFFDNISSTIDFRGRTPKKLGLEWSESGYLALSALNIKNGYIDPSADAHYGDEELYNKWMGGRELKKGQVLFTTEAPMGNVAQVPDNKGYILSQRTVAFEIKEDMMTNDFLSILLKSPVVFNNLSALSSGGTAKGVSQKSLKGLSVTVPLDTEEQKKIGAFFKSIDNTITLHQRKLDQIKTLKQAYLQKIFPSNSRSLPELRFANFSNNWENRKLGDIADVTKLAGFEFTKYVTYSNTGKIIALRGLNVKNGKLILDDVKYIDNSDFSKLNRSKLYINDILFTYVGTIGELAVISENDKFYLAPNVARIRMKNGLDVTFMSQMMTNSMFFKRIIFPLIATSSQPALSMENVRKFVLDLPPLEEQIKIGALFKQLDENITFNQQKINKLNQLKAAYLQKMFI